MRNFQTDPPPLTVLPAQPTTPPVKPAPAAEPKADKEAPAGKKSANPSDGSERKFVRVGMTEAEVRAKLGEPGMTAGNKSRSNTRWTYLPAPASPFTSDGAKRNPVAEPFSAFVMPRNDWSGGVIAAYTEALDAH